MNDRLTSTSAGLTGDPIPVTLEAEAIPADDTAVEHLDVLVIGAGLSGIGAGHYLQTECPVGHLRHLRGT